MRGKTKAIGEVFEKMDVTVSQIPDFSDPVVEVLAFFGSIWP